MDYLYITFDPAKRPDGIHALTSEYVETFWLPSLGPSAILLLRLLGRIYEPLALTSPQAQTSISISTLAGSLGLGLRGGISRNSRLGGAIERLQYNRICEYTGPTSLTVAPYLPRLRQAQIERLPDALQFVLNPPTEVHV